MKISRYHLYYMLSGIIIKLYELDYKDINDNEVTIIPVISKDDDVCFKIEVQKDNYASAEFMNLTFIYNDEMGVKILYDNPFDLLVNQEVDYINLDELEYDGGYFLEGKILREYT